MITNLRNMTYIFGLLALFSSKISAKNTVELHDLIDESVEAIHNDSDGQVLFLKSSNLVPFLADENSAPYCSDLAAGDRVILEVELPALNVISCLIDESP